MTQMLRDVVQIQGGFKPSVQLPNDFFREEDNRHFVENYIPTQETLDIFIRIKDSLQPHSERRAKLFIGTYGTGKSDLMLMIANYVTRSSDNPLLQPFFERLRNLNNSKAEIIYQARLGKPPFLLVLLQADTANTFSSFVLRGLEEALIQVGQQDVLGTTYYRAALDQIADWEQHLPDNILRLEKELQEAHNMTLAQLKHNLKSPQTDLALGIFKDATHVAIGLPFQPTSVIERPRDAFEAVAKQLVESGKFSGIFLIADEFTHLLQKLAESSIASPDIKAIDNLAETAARSGKDQIHFYIVSLEGFSSTQASTRTSQTALERTGGRFIQGQEELRSQYMEELISASIAKKVPLERLFANASQQQDELLSLTMYLWGNLSTGRHNREWLRETVIQGCFPLHPLATYCLPLLNRVLAQNERTMFSFLWDEQYGLKAFINTTELVTANGWFPLLSLDGLFNYFETNLRERRSDLDLLYQQAKSKLSPQQVSVGLEGRLLRVLILLDVASGDANLRASNDLLHHALGLPSSQSVQIGAALRQLEEAGIAYPTQAGYYQLVKQGQPNPRELRNAIERRAQEIIESPIEVLNEQYPLKSEKAAKYNSSYGTDRELSATFLSVSELKNITSIDQRLQNHDALLWYIVACTEEEQLQARSTAIQLTKQYDQLVIAIPFVPTALVGRLKRKMSMERLRYSRDYSRSDYQELLSNDGLVGKDYLSEFWRERQKFDDCSKFEWYYEGRTMSIQTPALLEDLATKVMKTVFPSTPAHKTAQHLAKSSRISPKLREALDEILTAPFKRSEKKSPVNAILIDGAGELGLIYFKEPERGYRIYDVCIPDSRLRNSKMVWEKLDKQLRDTSITLSDTIDLLKTRPYGLSSPVLQLFLAAFLRFNRDYIAVYSAKNVLEPIEIDGEKIGKIVESPKEYVILYKPLTEQQTEFLRRLINVLPPNSGYHKGEAIPLLDQIAKLLTQAIKDIPLISHRPSTSDLAKVLSDISQAELTVCEQLIKIGCLSDESLNAALLETLPQSLDLSGASTSWTHEMLERALSDVSNAYKHLQQIPKKTRHAIMLQIGQWFGLTEPAKSEKDVLEAAKKWRMERVRHVRIENVRDTLDAQELLKVLDDEPYSFEQVFLNTLPAQWKLQIFREWQAISTKETYLNRLEQAKKAIENKAGILAPSLSQVIADDNNLMAQSSAETSVLSEKRPTSPTQSAVVEPKTSSLRENISNSKGVETKSTAQPQSNCATTVSSSGNSDQKQVNGSATTSFEVLTQEKKTLVAEQPPNILSPQSSIENTVNRAFETIKALFENLSPTEQRKLWELLVEEYDPR